MSQRLSSSRHILAFAAALALAAPLAAQPGFGFVFATGPGGLVVQGVAADGAAAVAGIKTGDVLTAVGGRSMAGLTLDAAGTHFASFTSPPRSVSFEVRRGGIRFSALVFPTDYDRVALGESLPSAPRASPVPDGSGCVAGSCTDGTGSYRYESGATYAGAWRGGTRHGQGTFTFANGMTFVGRWADDRRVRGRETFTNGNAYEGDYMDDQRHGQGTFTWASGAQFVGEFVRNERVRGRAAYSNGNVYEGEFASDKSHGQGTMTFANGNVYTGAFADGVYSGTGRFTWTSGSVYEGQFAADKRHGQGTMRHADGRVEAGEWREDVFVGRTVTPRVTDILGGGAP